MRKPLEDRGLFGRQTNPDIFAFARNLGNMDIFNKPPQIGEDTIQYTLYPPANQSGKEDVESLATLILSSVADLFPNHLWNRDSFDFTPAQDPDSPKGQTRWLLEGRMRVGDCVDDEWLVVWLLREISKHWDVAIRYVPVISSGLSLMNLISFRENQRV